jgi:hypothetical protein
MLVIKMVIFKKRKEAAIDKKLAEIKAMIAEAKQKNSDIDSREWLRVKTEDMKYLGYKMKNIVIYDLYYTEGQLELDTSDEEIMDLINDLSIRSLKDLRIQVCEEKDLDRCMITGMECEVRKRKEMSCTMCNEPLIHIDDIDNL